MKELLEYRVKMIARLAAAADEFCSACMALSDPFTKVEGEWSAHQIAAHTRDVDKMIYGARIRQTLHEEEPEFKSFDADAWMADHYNKAELLKKILNDFSASMDDLSNILQSMPSESWSRESRHETMGGGLTLQLWVERSLAHIEEHLLALKNAAAAP